MKKGFLAICFIVMALAVNAQIFDPVKWSYTAKKIGPKIYELHFTATLAPKWHIYSQDAGEETVPTTFAFTANPLITLDGKVKEVGKMEKVFDKNFNATLKYYGNKVDFVQKVKVKVAAPTVVKGTVSYIVCDDSKCLPPKDVAFSIAISGK